MCLSVEAALFAKEAGETADKIREILKGTHKALAEQKGHEITHAATEPARDFAARLRGKAQSSASSVVPIARKAVEATKPR